MRRAAGGDSVFAAEPPSTGQVEEGGRRAGPIDLLQSRKTELWR
jgi:hypothetical protein